VSAPAQFVASLTRVLRFFHNPNGLRSALVGIAAALLGAGGYLFSKIQL
jgi:hypothetical protein